MILKCERADHSLIYLCDDGSFGDGVGGGGGEGDNDLAKCRPSLCPSFLPSRLRESETETESEHRFVKRDRNSSAAVAV